MDGWDSQLVKQRHPDAEVVRGFMLGEAANHRAREGRFVHRRAGKASASIVSAKHHGPNLLGRLTANDGVVARSRHCSLPAQVDERAEAVDSIPRVYGLS